MTKSGLHVEYNSHDMDDDLGICSEDIDDDMDTEVILSLCGLSADVPVWRSPELIKVLS